MIVYLRDRNQDLVNIWKHMFKNHLDVKVSYGNDIFADGEHMEAESIISPAQSFGYMDGGIDLAYSKFFGWGVEKLLREYLKEHYFGELLVGQAVIIDMRKAKDVTENVNKIPYLISAPTMRVPEDVKHSVNAYLSFIAALRVAETNNIKSVLCPGLCTGIGEMPFANCAVQMYEAYKCYKNPRMYDCLGTAHVRHHMMLNPMAYHD